jgi:hypothetical protein
MAASENPNRPAGHVAGIFKLSSLDRVSETNRSHLSVESISNRDISARIDLEIGPSPDTFITNAPI